MSLTSFSVPASEPAPTIELLSSGVAAFARILQRIDARPAQHPDPLLRVADDDTGQSMPRALLAAADRGVEVTILKDRLGGFYEHLDGTKQSFFHKRINFDPALADSGRLMAFYGRWGSLRQKPSAARRRAARPPRVSA